MTGPPGSLTADPVTYDLFAYPHVVPLPD